MTTGDGFEGVRLVTSGKARHLELRWQGISTPLRYDGFPVWIGGRRLPIPILELSRVGEGWAAAGELETDSGTWQVEDGLTPHGNTVTIDRTWRWRGGRLPSVRLGLDLDVPFAAVDFWAIPYVSINGNLGSRTVPTGMEYRGEPWVFREERTTAPGLMTVESDGLVAGSYTEPGRSEQTVSACCILPGGGTHTLRTFFPFRESPRTFLGAGYPGNANVPEQGLYTSGSGPRGFLVEGEARFRRRFFVVLDRAPEPRHGYVRVWESAWRHLGEPMAAAVPVENTERELWRSLDRFWVEEGTACGYVLRIDRDGGRFGGFTPVFSAGWCAPTMMLAWLGIRRAIRAQRPAPADRPMRAAEFFIDRAPRRNGAFLTHFDVRSLTWTEREINAVQMGGAAFWILRCLELARTTTLFDDRIDGAAWADFALGFCDLAARTQLPTGAFPSRWTLDGDCRGSERTMGVHAARAVLEAYRHTGEQRYLDAAERAAAFTIREIVDRETGYGDCTDILNTTTENDGAGVPDFLIDLYRVTGEGRYLEKAVRAAEYCLAFTFAYNVHFPAETESARRGMRTRGLGAISPETAFVCWWFALQANAFLELWKETGERRWKDYAVAVIRASLQVRTEPGDTFGLAEHLVGIRAEVIPVLDTVKGAHVWKKGMTGYTWHQPVWWPAAFNLLNFACIEDHCPDLKQELER